jgi:ketosteroid isomerase-like protein
MNTRHILASLAATAVVNASAPIDAAEDPAAVVAALDTQYQAAVEQNDWRTMERILHPDFVLVVGSGTVFDRASLIDSAKNPQRTYEKQVEMPDTRKVRVFGKDTAVITALLWLKGKDLKSGEEFDYKLWFSDTYVRTKGGWKYAFGQASRRLD